MGKIYSIVDGNRAQAVKKEQQGGVDIMEEVSGLMTLGAQRKADLSGPTVRDQERDQKLTKLAKIIFQSYNSAQNLAISAKTADIHSSHHHVNIYNKELFCCLT